MPTLKRIVKAKTQLGKRKLEHKAPKLIENTKTAVFIRGAKTSDKIVKCMKDLAALKRPNGIFFGEKHDFQPFEDAVALESFAEKQDASLFMFGSHNKKRPHNLVIGRMYDTHILDMIELGLDDYKGLQDFKGAKIATGTKPQLVFLGQAFEEEDGVHQRLRNLLMDYFCGPEVEKINLLGMEHVLVFFAIEGKIQIKSYRKIMEKSGTSIPRIELVEIGPSVDLVVRRHKLASDDLYKRATKRPVQLKKKKVKNVKKDSFGRQMGRLHMKKQDLNRLQTRKMKGLKKVTPKKAKGVSNRGMASSKRKSVEGGAKGKGPPRKMQKKSKALTPLQ